MMKHSLFTLLFVTIAGSWGFCYGEELNFPATTVRSPEGQQRLEQLQARIERTFKSKRIDRRYLAARKLVQLNKNELSKNLLNAAIESMSIDNPYYRWYLAHYLQKISDKQYGVHQQSWRDWLRDEYTPTKKKVGNGPVPATVKSVSLSKEITSPIIILDKTNSVDRLDVAEGDKVTEMVNDKIVKEKEKLAPVDSNSVLGDTGTNPAPEPVDPVVISKQMKPTDAPSSNNSTADPKKTEENKNVATESSHKKMDPTNKEGSSSEDEPTEKPSNFSPKP